MKLYMTEVELARVIIDWLKRENWEVYQEVQLFCDGPVADIIAVGRVGKVEVFSIVECKTSLSAAVLAQAEYWRRYFIPHYVSVGVPLVRRSSGRAVMKEYLRWKGIGLIEVFSTKDCVEEIAPKLHRPHKIWVEKLRNCLTELHKDYAPAGNPESRRVTAFGLTRDNVIDYVRWHPGCGLDELLNNIDTHYSSRSSAKTSIGKWIHCGVIRGIRIEKDGRQRKLYPEK